MTSTILKGINLILSESLHPDEYKGLKRFAESMGANVTSEMKPGSIYITRVIGQGLHKQHIIEETSLYTKYLNLLSDSSSLSSSSSISLSSSLSSPPGRQSIGKLNLNFILEKLNSNTNASTYFNSNPPVATTSSSSLSQSSSATSTTSGTSLSSSLPLSIYHPYYNREFRNVIKNKLDIIKPSWLRKCFEEKKLINTKDFKLLPLENLKFCITGGKNLNDRENLAINLIELGGKFSDKMNENNCTHLIVLDYDENSVRSKKIEFARELGKIYIVTVDWVYEVKRQNRWVPEELFFFTEPEPSPEPEKKRRKSLQIDTNIGDEKDEKMIENEENLNDINKNNEDQNENIDKIDKSDKKLEKNEKNEKKKKNSLLFLSSHRSIENWIKYLDEFFYNYLYSFVNSDYFYYTKFIKLFNMSEKERREEKQKKENEERRMKYKKEEQNETSKIEIKNKKINPNQFFNNYWFYFDNFSSNNETFLASLILKNNGRISPCFDSSVTHIILSPNSDESKLLDYVKDPSKITWVNTFWIVEHFLNDSQHLRDLVLECENFRQQQ